jgi:hypothetical protein
VSAPADVPARLARDPDGSRLEAWDLEPSARLLEELLTDLFRNHWQGITFGPLIQGAAWEITATGPPERLGMQDGYLTVDFGPMHFHLCIGEHRGSAAHPVSPELAAHRRTRRAELYRRINGDGTPDGWGLRLFNGKGEEQITVLFPNPFLTRDLGVRAQPEWSALALWDAVRQRYLGLGPDPRDRSGRRFLHP